MLWSESLNLENASEVGSIMRDTDSNINWPSQVLGDDCGLNITENDNPTHLSERHNYIEACVKSVPRYASRHTSGGALDAGGAFQDVDECYSASPSAEERHRASRETPAIEWDLPKNGPETEEDFWLSGSENNLERDTRDERYQFRTERGDGSEVKDKWQLNSRPSSLSLDLQGVARGIEGPANDPSTPEEFFDAPGEPVLLSDAMVSSVRSQEHEEDFEEFKDALDVQPADSNTFRKNSVTRNDEHEIDFFGAEELIYNKESHRYNGRSDFTLSDGDQTGILGVKQPSAGGEGSGKRNAETHVMLEASHSVIAETFNTLTENPTEKVTDSRVFVSRATSGGTGANTFLANDTQTKANRPSKASEPLALNKEGENTVFAMLNKTNEHNNSRVGDENFSKSLKPSGFRLRDKFVPINERAESSLNEETLKIVKMLENDKVCRVPRLNMGLQDRLQSLMQRSGGKKVTYNKAPRFCSTLVKTIVRRTTERIDSHSDSFESFKRSRKEESASKMATNNQMGYFAEGSKVNNDPSYREDIQQCNTINSRQEKPTNAFASPNRQPSRQIRQNDQAGDMAAATQFKTDALLTEKDLSDSQPLDTSDFRFAERSHRNVLTLIGFGKHEFEWLNDIERSGEAIGEVSLIDSPAASVDSQNDENSTASTHDKVTNDVEDIAPPLNRCGSSLRDDLSLRETLQRRYSGETVEGNNILESDVNYYDCHASHNGVVEKKELHRSLNSVQKDGYHEEIAIPINETENELQSPSDIHLTDVNDGTEHSTEEGKALEDNISPIFKKTNEYKVGSVMEENIKPETLFDVGESEKINNYTNDLTSTIAQRSIDEAVPSIGHSTAANAISSVDHNGSSVSNTSDGHPSETNLFTSESQVGSSYFTTDFWSPEVPSENESGTAASAVGTPGPNNKHDPSTGDFKISSQRTGKQDRRMPSRVTRQAKDDQIDLKQHIASLNKVSTKLMTKVRDHRPEQTNYRASLTTSLAAAITQAASAPPKTKRTGLKKVKRTVKKSESLQKNESEEPPSPSSPVDMSDEGFPQDMEDGFWPPSQEGESPLPEPELASGNSNCPELRQAKRTIDLGEAPVKNKSQKCKSSSVMSAADSSDEEMSPKIDGDANQCQTVEGDQVLQLVSSAGPKFKGEVTPSPEEGGEGDPVRQPELKTKLSVERKATATRSRTEKPQNFYEIDDEAPQEGEAIPAVPQEGIHPHMSWCEVEKIKPVAKSSLASDSRLPRAKQPTKTSVPIKHAPSSGISHEKICGISTEQTNVVNPLPVEAKIMSVSETTEMSHQKTPKVPTERSKASSSLPGRAKMMSVSETDFPETLKVTKQTFSPIEGLKAPLPQEKTFSKIPAASESADIGTGNSQQATEQTSAKTPSSPTRNTPDSEDPPPLRPRRRFDLTSESDEVVEKDPVKRWNETAIMQLKAKNMLLRHCSNSTFPTIRRKGDSARKLYVQSTKPPAVKTPQSQPETSQTTNEESAQGKRRSSPMEKADDTHKIRRVQDTRQESMEKEPVDAASDQRDTIEHIAPCSKQNSFEEVPPVDPHSQKTIPCIKQNSFEELPPIVPRHHRSRSCSKQNSFEELPSVTEDSQQNDRRPTEPQSEVPHSRRGSRVRRGSSHAQSRRSSADRGHAGSRRGTKVNFSENALRKCLEVAIDKCEETGILNKEDMARVEVGLDLNKSLASAVARNNTNRVRELLSRGANPNISSGHLPGLLRAAKDGSLYVVQALIGAGADVDARSEQGNSALHEAARAGHNEVVVYLIYSNAFVDAINRNGVTPLQTALAYGQVDVIKTLIRFNADVHQQNKVGESAISMAEHLGYVGLRGTSVEVRRDSGPGTRAEVFHIEVPVAVQLILGLEEGCPLAIEDCLSRGANCNTIVPLALHWPACATVLHRAAHHGHDLIARLLLQAGADVNAKDVVGNTPLHAAAQAGHNKVVKVLLANGASMEATSRSGMTPLHRAASRGKELTCNLLMRRGANASAADGDGRTPADWATKRGFASVARRLGHRRKDSSELRADEDHRAYIKYLDDLYQASQMEASRASPQHDVEM